MPRLIDSHTHAVGLGEARRRVDLIGVETDRRRRALNAASRIVGSAAKRRFALSCASKAEVNRMVETAVAAGGRHAMDPQDHGPMYGWSFYDLDGHHWEVLWMDQGA